MDKVAGYLNWVSKTIKTQSYFVEFLKDPIEVSNYYMMEKYRENEAANKCQFYVFRVLAIVTINSN